MTDESTLLANARDLVAQKVDVLAVSIDPAILAASKVAGSVPIVMLNVSDPVELGLVASLAHPGGNITGLTRLTPELVGKNLQVLLEAVPDAKRIGLLVSAANAMNRLSFRNARQAAQTRGLTLQVVELRTSAEVETAFATLKLGGSEALLVSDSRIRPVPPRIIVAPPDSSTRFCEARKRAISRSSNQPNSSLRST